MLPKILIYPTGDSKRLIFASVKRRRELNQLLDTHKAAYLSLSGEFFYLAPLVLCFFSRHFWSGQRKKAYLYSFIKLHRPRIILSDMDNDEVFWEVQADFPNTAVILVQHGIAVGPLEKQKSRRGIFFLLSLSRASGELISSRLGNCPFVPIGSFYSNEVEILRGPRRNTLLFISQFELSGADWVEPNGNRIPSSLFYSPEFKLLPLLAKFCFQKQLKLRILPRQSGEANQAIEREFYYSILSQGQPNEAGSKVRPEFEIRETGMNAFYWTDTSEFVVTIDSTLGYEALSRGTKAIFFPWRNEFHEVKTYSFGWPARLPTSGLFWCEDSDEHSVFSALESLFLAQWTQVQSAYSMIEPEVITRDPGNLRLRKVLSDLS